MPRHRPRQHEGKREQGGDGIAGVTAAQREDQPARNRQRDRADHHRPGSQAQAIVAQQHTHRQPVGIEKAGRAGGRRQAGVVDVRLAVGELVRVLEVNVDVVQRHDDLAMSGRQRRGQVDAEDEACQRAAQRPDSERASSSRCVVWSARRWLVRGRRVRRWVRHARKCTVADRVCSMARHLVEIVAEARRSVFPHRTSASVAALNIGHDRVTIRFSRSLSQHTRYSLALCTKRYRERASNCVGLACSGRQASRRIF